MTSFIDVHYLPLALLPPLPRLCHQRQSSSRIRVPSRQCLWRDLERTLQSLTSAPIVRRNHTKATAIVEEEDRNTVNQFHRTANFYSMYDD